jgi:all-trans-nonaprenyl-diphosphate synthase
MGSLRQKQHRDLALLIEMIHVASLIHDDVVDGSDMRRGGATLHAQFGVKLAVLAGDFLLARASVVLGGLHDTRVVQLVSTALDSLVTGELMQISSREGSAENCNHMLSQYLRKTYMKTASLISSATKSTALLSDRAASDSVVDSCERFGYHLGMAFQVVDDILDFVGQSDSLGKPVQADMKLGIATAPVLFASKEIPILCALIDRGFEEPGDLAQATSLVTESHGVEQSYRLAHFHAHLASIALLELPPSVYRDALMELLRMTVCRDS